VERIAQAVEMFRQEYSCAQSLLAVYGPEYGLDRATALRLAAPLGGGVSRTDGTCGAVSGAVLVLGLARGFTAPDDEAGHERIRALTREFLDRYRARRGATLCTDLLGENFSLPGVAERVAETGLTQQVCPDLVRTAAEILEELLARSD
jgi:C_GCAxxG_C_C family probable redox protein